MTNPYLLHDSAAGRIRRTLVVEATSTLRSLIEVKTYAFPVCCEKHDHLGVAARWELLRRVAFGEEPASS